MGHEASGTVLEIGPAVTTLKTGDKVAMEPGVPCRRCVRCKQGNYHFCPDMRFAASPPDTHGTLTKIFRLQEDLCYKLPDEVSLQEGVLVEPLSVAVHAVKLSTIKPGDAVIVFGAGPVGLLCARVAKVFGAEKVVVVDIVPKRLEFAAKYASCEVFKPDGTTSATENARRLIEECALPSDGVDAVMDASGAEPSIQTGILSLRMGGTYVQVGMGRAEVTFPIMALCTKEIAVKGCFRYGAGDFELAIGMLRSGKISVKELISGVVPLEQATEAWETVRRGEGIKTLIQGVGDEK